MNVLQAHQALCHKSSAVRSAYPPSTQYHYQADMTPLGQIGHFQETGYNAIDPSASSFAPATFSTYSRGYYTAQRNTPPTTSAYLQSNNHITGICSMFTRI
ncbi:unnamed protein product [Acanthoscelides obtectus]|uniref:Uncharacterized protein n=1 Tax=Acanthoscelides obtectus TaxID=200917 RepID=A0A9P0KKF2_ACAOB|nr:unnamed protein product [Acanthoscelides obtectus]CAK1672395.1 hypothetical protein AOBTE_LOCUS28855 [Acanthoscelides obtectus]